MSSGPSKTEPADSARILPSAQDATEVLQFQAAMQESQNRYQALIEASAQIVWTTDPSGAAVEDSTSWRRFTGQSYEQWKGFGWIEAVHPDDRERVSELWHCAVAERTALETEYRIRHISGDWRWMAVRAVPVVSADGLIREWVGMNIDITVRKHAEEAQARLAAIVESSDDAIISKDLSGIITSWNKSAEWLFGYTAQEAVGKPVTILIPPERFDEEASILERVRRGERIDHYETVRRRKDGTLIDVSLTVSPVANNQGQVVGASKIARDITERKRAEQELREADHRKNEFLAMLAHELRNPLAPILNALEIMRRRKDNAQALQSASEMMERQLSQMVRLVDDLLDVSRISRGKIQLRRGPIELASAVNHAVEASRPLMESKGIELSVLLPPHPIYVNADPIRLAQVVGNLLSNACKFTGDGGRIWLTIELANTGDLSPEGVLIRVRDTGIGIPSEQLDRIFDMFMQGDTSLERAASGLGIGLTLAKNLVELHEGTLEAYSAGTGQGSEFVVRLPVLSEAPKPAQPDPVLAETKTAPTRRILIVDDNEDSAESLTMLLNLAGHKTHTAYDGLDAIEMAATFRPDLILLDIGLPKLNGYEVARKIREQPWGQAIVVVALTGWGQEEDRRRSRDAGFNHHLTKPVDPLALTRLLSSLSLAQSAS
jgi:two-component system, chemotaxis family, CheB/CheR fusion protein